MLFVATLTHPPELCLARKEYIEEGKRWIQGLEESAKELGVKIHGAYVSPNEHTFYFVFDSDSLKAASELLGPPMLTHHSARLSPVLDFKEVYDLALTFEEG
ncbi:MAG: DUF3303 domain-containing protein [Candidatus Geothermarchaeales archaeon]